MIDQDLENTEAAQWERIKAAANRTSNWRERLEAVDKLGELDSDQAIRLLQHRLINDSVYRVQEAAYRKLRALGEDVQMPAKKHRESMKDLSKILLRIKKSLPEDHSYEEFKEKFKKMRLDVYDTYEGNKGDEFDSWLKGVWATLGTKRS
ncbi:HEAT repeat domain-containing protein [Paenibacillus sp. GD4]|uniref:HEAT repeat domain-containing protein n=1 Tax=Paenibacillus sp. GD4 TaxID=3068890 RepID=UPI002796D0E8|nr:HEAT repeat domain-containing protein [Paenibacillus sp. GD4]MDQ1914322.1 HEAT repeat domain-containing protein [Paenibacillus sp. GD4]